MTERNFNYIAGEWLAGESEIENRNPSDLSDVIGRYAQAGADQVEAALDAARVGAGLGGGRFGRRPGRAI
jgi:aldehyde dehydrogenase (NAD+)